MPRLAKEHPLFESKYKFKTIREVHNTLALCRGQNLEKRRKKRQGKINKYKDRKEEETKRRYEEQSTQRKKASNKPLRRQGNKKETTE